MPEQHTATWKLVTGYALFSLAAFVFFFYLTFPYDTVKDRVQTEARARGYLVTIGDLGPGLFGITAEDVTLRKAKAVQIEGLPEREPQPLMIDSLSVRPALFPPGAAFRANVLDGVAAGAVGGLSDVSVTAHLDELDLSKGNLEGFSGLKLAGTVSGEVALTVPRSELPGGKGSVPDLGAASGSLSLEGAGLTVNGGTIIMPMYGQPTPVDLPKIILGDLDAQVEVDKGLATVTALSAKSTDLELRGEGTVKLARNVDYSELNLQLRFKIEDDLKKRLGPLSMGLSMIPRDPKDPDWNAGKVTGFLGRPNFR